MTTQHAGVLQNLHRGLLLLRLAGLLEQDTVSHRGEKNPLISTSETNFGSMFVFEIEKRWTEQKKQQGAVCKQGTATSSNLWAQQSYISAEPPERTSFAAA